MIRCRSKSGELYERYPKAGRGLPTSASLESQVWKYKPFIFSAACMDGGHSRANRYQESRGYASGCKASCRVFRKTVARVLLGRRVFL